MDYLYDLWRIIGIPHIALMWLHPRAAVQHYKYNLFLPAFLWWSVTKHRLASHRTRPQSANSTTITCVLGIKNTFETASHKYVTEEILLFSYTTFLVWLALLSLLREGLNPLTRPESTLTGLIQKLSWGSPRYWLTDWWRWMLSGVVQLHWAFKQH